MSRKLSYEEVREIIEKEGCKLLSTEYTKASEKLLIQCACGEEFEVKFHTFKNGQKQCPKCGIEKRAEKQKNRVIFNCEYCGKESSRKKSHFEKTKHHFCSEECRVKWKKDKIITFNCEYCGKESSTNKAEFERYEHHFCSKECYGKWQDDKIIFNCEYCGKESSRKKSEFKNHGHHFCSKECYDEWKKIYTPKGENSPYWNPNITDEERKRGRHIEGYGAFTNGVLKRDNGVCQCCEEKNNLFVHHLNSYHWDIEHRVDINNGVVLCEKCHKEFHRLYGNKNNTIAQFREFLFNKYTQTKDLKFLALIETIDLTTRAF